MQPYDSKNFARTMARQDGSRSGFTLMELMVAVSILVVIILAVNVTFSGASKQVGTSQATMDMMAGIRGIQSMIEHDVRSMDRNGFLVIRSRLFDPTSGDAAYRDRMWRFDQLSFLATGEFPNPSGADSTNPFTDSSTTNAAHIWIGQLVLEKGSGAPLSAQDANINYMVSGQGQMTPTDALPTGVGGPAGPTRQIVENVMALGHRATALFPGPTDFTQYNHLFPSGPLTPIVAHRSLNGADPANLSMGLKEQQVAHISSSRFGAVAKSPAQLMAEVAAARNGNANLNPEAENLTFRFRALRSVYDTEVPSISNPFVNGYYRSSPIVMMGVSSFRIDWSDGSVYPDGQLVWWGATNVHNDFYGPGNTTGVEHPASAVTGDDYIATFSYFNRQKWPKALKITFHVVNDRMAGGRDFVQVVNLPQ